MHSQLIAFGAVLGNVFLISLYMQAGKGLLLSHPRYPQNQRTSHRYATARKYLNKLEIISMLVLCHVQYLMYLYIICGRLLIGEKSSKIILVISSWNRPRSLILVYVGTCFTTSTIAYLLIFGLSCFSLIWSSIDAS